MTKRHVADAGCFTSDYQSDRLLTVDLCGAAGPDAVDGQSFHTPPGGAGLRGRRGGDASQAVPGQDAGRLHLSIGYADGRSDSGAIAVEGQVQLAQGERHEFAGKAAIDHPGYVFIRAAGGKGGDGGRGGDGGPGSTGRRGRDATRHSSGGNGGPGGDGGDAGNPSNGQQGGAGGDVVLSVDQEHQGLLMLVKGHLAGGEIGFAGEAGKGGDGGPGGPGGSSYHWTETRRYRDSEGQWQTKSVFRSNPGGHRGPAGRNGASSAYRAKDGVPGIPGLLRIDVVTPDGGTRSYPAPFDLELVSFDVASEYQVLEPDSLVSLDSLVIRNCGGMPLPANYTIRIHLPSDRWVESDQVDLVLHHAIQPGDTYTFTEAGLRFRITDQVVERPRRRPFVVRHPLSPVASIESGIGRPFQQFELPEEARFRFPLEVTPITALGSLAPGESTRVIWGITNVGTETFDHKHLYRAAETSIAVIGGDVDYDHLVFFDDGDDPHHIARQPHRIPLPGIKPGETRIIETRIGVSESTDVVHYQGFTIGVDLHLQRPGSSDRSDQYRRIDYRKSLIRISERYLRQPGSRFLLIANQRTSVSEIEKWTQLADYFGSGLDVWDVSYYGFLDLIRAVDRDKSLLEQWRGMTVIIPNNYYQTAAGTTIAFRMLAKSQFIQAAADHDINFYIVGDAHTGGEEMLQAALIPIGNEKLPSPLKSTKDFVRELRRWSKYVDRSRDVLGGATADARDLADVSLGAVHEFQINKRTWFRQPGPIWLWSQAEKLQRKLRKIDPLHRWIVVHRYDTGDTDTSWGLFRKRQVGRLEVRRTLDATKGSVVLYEVDSIDAIDEGFINSKPNKHGIFLALKFEDKVDRFVRLVSERKFPRYSEDYIDRPLSDEEVQGIGSELVDSILVDIYNEQLVARQSRTWGRGVQSLTPKLNYLAERALNYGLTYRQMQENETTVGLLLDLIANLRYMTKQSRSIWDSAWNPVSFFRRSRALSAHMLDRIDRIVTSIFGRQPSWWQNWTSSKGKNDFGTGSDRNEDRIERKAADQQIAEREAELVRSKRTLQSYSAAQDHPGLTYDPELLSYGTRVLNGQQFDQLVTQEVHADEYRRTTERAVKDKRSDLLVPLPREQAIPTVTTQQIR